MRAGTQDFTPKQLPFLPGNSYADPTITRYHKAQLLNVKDGAVQGKLFQLIRRANEAHSRRC